MAWLNRREFLKVLGVTTAAGTAARPGLCAARPQAASERKPNFIIIFTDDQGYGDLTCFGSKRIDSKHLDRMAAEGMKFTSFYVVGAVCTPSRAGLMTGCYAQRVGLPGVLFPNSMPRGQRDGQAVGLNPDEVTIAEVLKEVGYATCCIGKWHLGDRKQLLPTSHGFDEYFGLPYSNDMHLANKKYKWPPLPLMRNEEVVEREPDQDHLTRRYTEEAITFIRKNRDRPFFLYLPHSMPHRPIHVSPAFAKRFSKEEMAQIGKRPYKADRDFLYPGAIEEIDWSCGQILRALKDLGIDDHTLVVFTSDNGPAVPGSAGPLRGGKGAAFEGGMRVPCIMRWPGKVAAGTVCDEIATAMDFLPTFATLAGGTVPTDRVIDGKDIWPLISGRAGAKTPHEAFFYHRGMRLAAVRSGKWKLFLSGGAAAKGKGRGGKGGGRPVAGPLYDIEADIGEKNNVAAAHPDVVERLAAMARKFEQERVGSSRPAGLAPLRK